MRDGPELVQIWQFGSRPNIGWPRSVRDGPELVQIWQFGSAGSTQVACPTSVPERLELYGEVRRKPPTLRRRAPKNTPPPFGGYLKSEKSAILTHFSGNFQLFESKLQHFCVLTSFAGAMQKRRKCYKYQYVFNQRCTKHCKYQCF